MHTQEMASPALEYDLDFQLPLFHNRDYWFLPEVSAKLALIKQMIADLDAP